MRESERGFNCVASFSLHERELRLMGAAVRSLAILLLLLAAAGHVDASDELDEYEPEVEPSSLEQHAHATHDQETGSQYDFIRE